MAGLEYRFTVQMRQAMLDVYEAEYTEYGPKPIMHRTGQRVPVLVWSIPTHDGYFIVEHQDGHCQRVQPYELTFLGSKELFDQYSWEEA